MTKRSDRMDEKAGIAKKPAERKMALPKATIRPKTRRRKERRTSSKPKVVRPRPKFAKRPYKPRPASPIPKPVFWPISELPGSHPIVGTGHGNAVTQPETWGNRDYLALVEAEPRCGHEATAHGSQGYQVGYLMAVTIRHRPDRNPHNSFRPVAIYALESAMPVEAAKPGLLRRLFGVRDRPTHMAVVRFTQGARTILAKMDYAEGFVTNRRTLMDHARRDLRTRGRFTLEPSP